MEDFIKKYIKGDYVIWTIYLVLLAFSILVVFSATSQQVSFASTTTEQVLRHIMFLALGSVILLIVYSLSKKLIKVCSWLSLFCCIPLLAWLFWKGEDYQGAARSVGLFQPSELAKFALIIVAADFIDKFQNTDFLNRYFLLFCIIVWLTIGLVFPMNLSMSIIIFVPILVMLMIGAIPWKKIGIFVGVPFVAVLLLAAVVSIMPKESDNTAAKTLDKFRIDTWVGRFRNHIDITEKWKEQETNAEKWELIQSDEYKQVILAGSAIYDGKLGVVPGSSIWRNQLPDVSKDFVFALIVEEYGWIGAIGTIFLYMWLLWRAGVLIRKTDTVFSAVVIVGAAMVICFQAFVHIGVNVGLIPVTGQTLPLLSKGGTSIVVISAFFGLMLGMSRRAEQDELPKGLPEDEIQATEDIPIYTEQQDTSEFSIK